MPIANCFVTSACVENGDDLAALWAKASDQSSKHMTINVIRIDKQYGNPYAVMATLILPDSWSDSAISKLQQGLANAISIHFNLTVDQVHIVTTFVISGMVVESGVEVEW